MIFRYCAAGNLPSYSAAAPWWSQNTSYCSKLHSFGIKTLLSFLTLNLCVCPQPTQQQHFDNVTPRNRDCRQGLCYAKANSSLTTSTPKLRRSVFPTTVINSRVHPHQSHSRPDRGKCTRTYTCHPRRVSMERRRNHSSIKINKTTRKSSHRSARMLLEKIPSSYESDSPR